MRCEINDSLQSGPKCELALIRESACAILLPPRSELFCQPNCPTEKSLSPSESKFDILHATPKYSVFISIHQTPHSKHEAIYATHLFTLLPLCLTPDQISIHLPY